MEYLILIQKNLRMEISNGNEAQIIKLSKLHNQIFECHTILNVIYAPALFSRILMLGLVACVLGFDFSVVSE